MTIQGAVYELEKMLSRTDIPDYIKPIIKKVIETIVDEFSDQQMEEGKMKQERIADIEMKLDKKVIDEAVQKAVEDIKQNFIAKSEVIEWLNSFDTNSATKCYEAVNLLKERVEHEET